MLEDEDAGDKTTSSYLNSMSHSHVAGDSAAGAGFFPFPPPQNVFHGYETSGGVYDSAGMLSEMFDFGGGRQSIEHHNPHISGDSSEAAMHLFFTNPPLKSSPALISDQGFHAPQFTWIPEGSSSGAGENQGLSLSLASEKAVVDGYNNNNTRVCLTPNNEMMFFNTAAHEPLRTHFGLGATSSSVFSLAAVNVLRNSKYTRPSQELLEEFCSVGRGIHHKKSNPPASGSATKEPTPSITPAERIEHQRRKVKLTTMLDEVERRYSHYCEQLQMVVNSYEMVMGFGAAVPYTALAQKAMSRHFRCLKDGVQAQLRHSCEVLGEKDLVGGMGITKGETPRLKMLEHNLRKQRAFHQMGIMEQDAWRPQRGLPERSVNILRAWLFEHFLHPYPSDADKHLLARQTGLSRNQVANWFINARVRLWKPMIEDMYQQESKDQQEQEPEQEPERNEEEDEEEEQLIIRKTQTPTHLPPLSSPKTTTLAITDENDTSLISSESGHHHHLPANYMLRHHHHHHHNTTSFSQFGTTTTTTTPAGSSSGVGPTMIRFGTTSSPAGDVSLTLGLRHGDTVGRNPNSDKTGFSFTEFGSSS